MIEIKIEKGKVSSAVNGSTPDVIQECVFAYHVLGKNIQKVVGCSLETALNVLHEITLKNSKGLDNADTTVIDLSGVKRKNDKD